MKNFKLHYKGFGELRRDPGVKAFVRKVAERVSDDAGPGFKVEDASGKRARFIVRPETPAAYRANYVDHALIGATNKKGA